MASMTVPQISQESAGPIPDQKLLAEYVLLTAECARASMMCADACLAARDIEPLRRCIRLALDCADICEATGRLLLRPHDPQPAVLHHLLEALRLMCRACAAECSRHADRHEGCRICHEVCGRCAAASARLREALDRRSETAPTQH